MNDVVYTFQPRWKEELVCTCPFGSLVLDMPMGIVSVYVPTEARWRTVAPVWAIEHWPALHAQLRDWCAQNDIPLHVDASAFVG